MDFFGLLRAVFALAIVLGLILGLAYVLRRYAPQLMARLQAERGERRLKVVETLVLDPARRLVLVRVDDEERLILLGDGREVEPPQTKAATRQRPKPILKAVPPAAPVSPPVEQDDDLF